MKKLTTIFLSLLCCSVLYGQTEFFDYTDNKEFSFYETTYRVVNRAEQVMNRVYPINKRLYVCLESAQNELFDHLGQYANGSYVQDPSEAHGIIRYAPNDRYILYHAMRNVFSLDELQNHPELRIFLHITIDNQGNILETSTVFPIQKSYIIQPQQIAALETMIRKNLTFVLDQEKAAKFNYFQGEVWLRFGDFIEEPTSLPQNTGYFIAGQEEERTKPLYTINLVEEFSGPTIIRSDGAPVYDRIGEMLLP